ncbi:MAG: hypothetical protein CVV24_05125 [Ignavibacteriae bacterium HGW-Ignavibacteriae-3]|nr:MAG: hypothetical protein CVV24_05125 [Ignavibacteriae bacterium HGW-Ignavibacteriae-3]
MNSPDKKGNSREFNNHFYLLILFLTICVTGCFESYNPESKVIDLSKYPGIAKYRFDKIALLPMIKDDTTDTGTFYSTNHFINKLTERFSNLSVDIPDISSITFSDPMLIPGLINSIERNRHLDMNVFNNSELGTLLLQENYDAIFLGTVESCYDLESFEKFDWSLINLRFDLIYVRNCYFNYYLISLADGRVLWRARILGQAVSLVNPDLKGKNYYPPVDCAVSNGIDTMMYYVPDLTGGKK